MIKGVLFDKDGTLLDFNGTWRTPYIEVSQYLADSIGHPEISEELMRKGGYIPETREWASDSLYTSGSNHQILEFWSSEIGIPIEGPHLARIQAIFSDAAQQGIPVMGDLRGFLSGLKDRGMVLGIATMDDEDNATGMLVRLKLEGLFDFVCGADSGYGVKPEPGMVHAFCRACGLLPEEVVMVGDSPVDLNMGKNAGVAIAAGVLTGPHGRDELEKFADVVMPDISNLVQLLT